MQRVREKIDWILRALATAGVKSVWRLHDFIISDQTQHTNKPTLPVAEVCLEVPRVHRGRHIILPMIMAFGMGSHYKGHISRPTADVGLRMCSIKLTNQHTGTAYGLDHAGALSHGNDIITSTHARVKFANLQIKRDSAKSSCHVPPEWLIHWWDSTGSDSFNSVSRSRLPPECYIIHIHKY